MMSLEGTTQGLTNENLFTIVTVNSSNPKFFSGRENSKSEAILTLTDGLSK